MYCTQDIQAIATKELYSHIECAQLPATVEKNQRRRQVSKIAPELLRIRSANHRATSRPIELRTPQRKARYHDKNRWRLKELKAAALRCAKCSDSKQMRSRLKALGVSLDLRYTSSWLAINLELMPLLEPIVEPQGESAISSERNLPLPEPIVTLVAAMKEACASSSWNPVKALLPTHAEYKEEAWNLLNATEKQQLSALVPEPLRLLSAAQRKGAIARFHEDSEGDIYWVWRTSDAQPELVTSCFAKIFLRNLATSSLLDAA